jgi:hypothetical protein
MKAKAKPAARNTADAGQCIEPGHGGAIVLSGGREWCPNQAHDMPEASTPWLEKQVIEDDQPATAAS